MIKLFSRIRQQLLSENKFSKYLLYGIGEIILVVIGILLALQINTWNEERKNAVSEQTYLMRLSQDIQSDVIWLESYIGDRYERKVKSLQMGKEYYQGTYTIKDTLDFLNRLGYGSVFGNIVWNFKKITYQQLTSTGDFDKISNDTLRLAILDYYNLLNGIEESTLNNETGYIKYTNARAPFNKDNPEYISEFDQKFLLKDLKSEEFYELLNLELRLAYDMNDKKNRIVVAAEALLIQMESELTSD